MSGPRHHVGSNGRLWPIRRCESRLCCPRNTAKWQSSRHCNWSDNLDRHWNFSRAQRVFWLTRGQRVTYCYITRLTVSRRVIDHPSTGARLHRTAARHFFASEGWRKPVAHCVDGTRVKPFVTDSAPNHVTRRPSEWRVRRRLRTTPRSGSWRPGLAGWRVPPMARSPGGAASRWPVLALSLSRPSRRPRRDSIAVRRGRR